MNEPVTFEQALAELEKIVERLQKPELPLDEAVALFRRGTELAEMTEGLLGAAELQVQELSQAVRERFAEYASDESEDNGL